MTPKELLEKRSAVYSRIAQLADKVKIEKRKMTDEERTSWNGWNVEFDDLTVQINDAKRMEQIGEKMGPGDSRNIPGRHDTNAREDRDRRERQARGDVDNFADDPTETRALRRGESTLSYLRARVPAAERDPFEGLTFGAYCRAMIAGPRNDLEKRALNEGGGPSGGYTVPVSLAARLIDRLRNETVVIRAGAQVVPLTTDENYIARLTGDPTPSWLGEGDANTSTDPTFGKIALRPRTCRFLVKASRELLADSLNINAALEQCFASTMALETDRVCLFGNGVNEPLGVNGLTGINSVEMGTNGAALTTWAKPLDTLYELQNDNVPPPYAMVYSARTAQAINKFVDSTGQPLLTPDVLRDVPRFVTNAVSNTQTQGSASNASSMFIANFSELLIGVRTGLTIDLLRERFADEFSYGFLVSMRMDVAAQHDESFARLIGIIP